ncbi:hypothetical protein [Streptomyces malaysiensis]|uniref:hypothetical protein n=1 Tax=Streptomyces malaysiensis TaxID=92644 RepID=UPI00085321A6|nr:hypothetical protein [Streptomyces sp. SPMA113]
MARIRPGRAASEIQLSTSTSRSVADAGIDICPQPARSTLAGVNKVSEISSSATICREWFDRLKAIPLIHQVAAEFGGGE